MTTPQKLQLVRFGEPFAACVDMVADPRRDPAPGELRVRNHFAGVNALFDLMVARNAVPYFSLTTPLDVGIEAVGVVEAVGDGVSGYAPGDAVAFTGLGLGYREVSYPNAAACYPIQAPRPEYLALIPTGISAVVGLERVAEAKPGETIAISAAAGGLGHILVQLAKRMGLTVIALAGSAEKCALTRELGADAAIDYRREDVPARLAALAPKGIDIGYDTVGGAIFDAFLDALALKGRLIVSGIADDINGVPDVVTAPRVAHKLYWKAASIRGFMNALFAEHHREAGERLISLYDEGALRVVIDASAPKGLPALATAQARLLSGANVGKLVVDLGG
jgi:NADPH-dependent curcumin reductase CurA